MRTIFLCVILSCILLTGLNNADAQKGDEDAIKKVIRDETSTFFHKDYDKWATTWHTILQLT